MFTILSYILLAILFSFIISFPITNLLYKYKVVRNGQYDDSFLQIPSRKDKAGKPIMGGLIIIVTVIVITVAFNFSRHYTLVPLAAFILCAGIGALDDILNIYGRKRPVRKLRHTIKLALHHAKPMNRVYYTLLIPWSAYKSVFYSFGSRLGTGLHPHEKVLVQMIAGALIAYWMYFRIHWSLLWLPGNHYLDIGWLLIPLIVFMVVFMANAVNITDGMDGLSGGLLLSCFVVFMVIAFDLGDMPTAELCATVVGSLLTYLYYNIKPARFEMGDVGSLALGALLATVAVFLHREIILFVCGMLFIVEIGSVIIQKYAKKHYNIQVFKMAPLHHHFELLGWSEEKIVMRAWVFAIIFAFLSLWIAQL
jgi:phospho-N-acetylmuramoyl-pentapeptide-transferase